MNIIDDIINTKNATQSYMNLSDRILFEDS